MGERSFGKLGFDAVVIGFIIFVVTFFGSMRLGWPDISNNLTVFGFVVPDIINNLTVLGFVILIVGIVLAIVGIITDDLREKAVNALIAGICFLIVVIGLIIIYDIIGEILSPY